MNTQYMLLVWFCCLTPLLFVFCCRNKDETRIAGNLREITGQKRDSSNSQVGEGRLNGALPAKQKSFLYQFQGRRRASRKCQGYQRSGMSTSASANSPDGRLTGLADVLVGNVLPLLTNLAGWLAIFWIFNLSSKTPIARPKHRYHSVNQTQCQTQETKRIERSRIANPKWIHSGSFSPCISSRRRILEEYMHDPALKATPVEQSQPTACMFSSLDQCNNNFSECGNSILNAVCKNTEEGTEFSHASAAQYDKLPDKVKPCYRLLHNNTSSGYKEDGDLSGLTAEDKGLEYDTTEMTTESANSRKYRMVKSENSHRIKSRDTHYLIRASSEVSLIKAGKAYRPDTQKIESYKTKEGLFHNSERVTRQSNHFQKPNRFEQKPPERCPLPFRKRKTSTPENPGKVNLIEEQWQERESKTSGSTIQAPDKQRPVKQADRTRERNGPCYLSSDELTRSIGPTFQISSVGNGYDKRPLDYSLNDPSYNASHQLFPEHSSARCTEQNMVADLLEFDDNSDNSIGKTQSMTQRATKIKPPKYVHLYQQEQDCLTVLRHNTDNRTPSSLPACGDKGEVASAAIDQFPDSGKDLSSNIARFQTFCQSLLDTSSFEEPDDADRFDSLGENEQDVLITDLQDETGYFETEKVFLTETIRDDECFGDSVFHNETISSEMCLGDPERKLENVPLFYNHLLSSCFEIDFTKDFIGCMTTFHQQFGSDGERNSAICDPSSTSDEQEDAAKDLECENGNFVPKHTSCTVTENPTQSPRGDEQACSKRSARSKMTAKPPEVPMDIDFVYVSSAAGRLIPVKDFIKVLESSYLGIDEKKEIVSEQYAIAREKCCLDWIEAIRSRGRRILPKWWLHRYMRCEGLESNKCRKRREWLERKQALALEEERLRERKDLHFLGARSDITKYLDEPSGAEKFLYEYDENGTPAFHVEDYFKAVLDQGHATSLSTAEMVNLNEGMPSRWTSPTLNMPVDSTDKCGRNPNHNNSAGGEPREYPVSGRKSGMQQDSEFTLGDRAKEDGSGDSLCE